MRCLFLLGAVCCLAASQCRAYDARLIRPERPGLQTDSHRMSLGFQVSTVSGNHPAPVVVGFMSAVLPGAGQLKLGKERGWIYLGLDVVTWFTYFALNAAGDQGVRDFQKFADHNWDQNRYEITASCGDALGPVDFDQESAALQDLKQNDLDSYYAEIGDRKEYACGWGDQSQRAFYNARRNHASDLSNTATNMIYLLMLNRLISAVDAARSASALSSGDAALDLDWRLDALGQPQVRVAINHSLR